jgi:hypothetical protein
LKTHGAISRKKAIKSRVFRDELSKPYVNQYLKARKDAGDICGEQWRDKDINGRFRDDLWHWWLR